jgi:hypothetical protein
MSENIWTRNPTEEGWYWEFDPDYIVAGRQRSPKIERLKKDPRIGEIRHLKALYAGPLTPPAISEFHLAVDPRVRPPEWQTPEQRKATTTSVSPPLDNPLVVRIRDCAIRGNHGTIYTLPRPARHHDIIAMMRAQGFTGAIPRDQGFVLSTGQYVDRVTAGVLAFATGQVEELTSPPNLFSEDLW